MLPRWINLIILAFWVYAAWELFAHDILPDLVVGPPPDFRTIARAETEGVSSWSILLEDETTPGGQQSVGQVKTRSVPQSDGGWRLDSTAWFDSEAMLKRTPFEAIRGERFEVLGSCWIDSQGNLDTFRVSMHEARLSKIDLLMIEGKLRDDEIQIRTGGIIPYLGPRSFPYEPHSVVQTSFSPLDRLPGLHVGQKWEQQVVNPITRQAMKCRSEVVGRQTIMYEGNPTSTLVVLTRAEGPSPSARTWVRTDGLVIRQEVPLVIRKLILQRLAEEPGNTTSYFADSWPRLDDQHPQGSSTPQPGRTRPHQDQTPSGDRR